MTTCVICPVIQPWDVNINKTLTLEALNGVSQSDIAPHSLGINVLLGTSPTVPAHKHGDTYNNRTHPYQLVDITVCVHLGSYTNYSDVKQFVEMIEVGRMFGVNRFLFYTSSVSASMLQYIEYYHRLGVVDIRPWTMPVYQLGHVVHETTYQFGRVLALNDCMYRNMYRTRYMAITDVGEIFVPRSYNDLGTMLRLLKPAVAYNFRVS